MSDKKVMYDHSKYIFPLLKPQHLFATFILVESTKKMSVLVMVSRVTAFILLTSRTFLTFPLQDENSLDETIAIDLSYLGEKVFVNPNPETGRRVEVWNETSLENPEELGEYAEGDIVFPKMSRNGLIAMTFRWPNGVVPYEIGGYYSESDLDVINRAIKVYKKYTCIT